METLKPYFKRLTLSTQQIQDFQGVVTKRGHAYIDDVGETHVVHYIVCKVTYLHVKLHHFLT